ncbi:MAG: prepilin-type N-terminal cleavage/methylation domain-containing protein [Kiritimatiellae bacterium]|nr:prepilin-type N-terminal cleavage/methylation domain-containing protein [Kiritimatiellia bacterium]
MTPCRPARRAGGFTLVELLAVVAILAVVAWLAAGRLSGLGADAKQKAAESDLREIRDAIARYLSDMEGLPRFCKVNPYLDDTRYDVFSTRVHLLFRGTNAPPAGLPRWSADGLLPDGPEGLWDAASGRGWRGPYLSSRLAAPWPGGGDWEERGFDTRYGSTNELSLRDPWGNPYVVQFPDPAAFAPLRGRTGPDRAAAEQWRWGYARIVSAGPDGRLDTPRDRCAGMDASGHATARGDDLVLFLNRPDAWDEEGAE